MQSAGGEIRTLEGLSHRISTTPFACFSWALRTFCREAKRRIFFAEAKKLVASVPIWRRKKGFLSPAHLTGLWYPCIKVKQEKALNSNDGKHFPVIEWRAKK